MKDNYRVLGDVRWCTACDNAKMEPIGYDVVTSCMNPFLTLALF